MEGDAVEWAGAGVLHRRGGVGGSVGELGAVLLLDARGRGQAERENGGHDVARAVGKVAVLRDLQPVQLDDSQVLVEAVAHAAQERLRHLPLEARLRNHPHHSVCYKSYC